VLCMYVCARRHVLAALLPYTVEKGGVLKVKQIAYDEKKERGVYVCVCVCDVCVLCVMMCVLCV